MPIALDQVSTSNNSHPTESPIKGKHAAPWSRPSMATHDESQWLFTEDELLVTPSIVDGGLAVAKARENRGKGVNFILQAGIMLRLPQNTVSTASVFLHRFYMRHSMVDTKSRAPAYHYYSMAATCLFLATKVEENCRKMAELVVACVRVAQKDPNKVVDDNDREYWRWRDNILASEDLLLETLCFDLSLEAPTKTLFGLLLQFHVEANKKLRNAAWAFVNDSCLTVLCLLFPNHVIAASAFYAAARYVGVAFPDDERGRPWWHSIGVEISEVRRACNIMADMYQNRPAKAGDGFTYEKTPEIADMSDATRMVGPSTDATPEHVARPSADPEGEETHSQIVNDGRRGDRDVVNGDVSSSNGISSKRKRTESSSESGNVDGAASRQRPRATTNCATSGEDVPMPLRDSGASAAKASSAEEEHLSEEGELES